MKIKELFFSPKEFFLHINKERGIRSAFIFFASCYFIFLVFSGLILYLFYSDSIKTILYDLPFSFTSFYFFLYLFLVYGFGLLSSFVSGFFLKMWLHLFKGKRSFDDAYKLSVYSYAPYYLLGWIPIINIFTIIYSLILLIIGTKVMYKFSTLKATLIYVIP